MNYWFLNQVSLQRSQIKLIGCSKIRLPKHMFAIYILTGEHMF